jgi:hypothetical protein
LVTAFGGYALKLNPIIDDIWSQPLNKLEEIKEELEMSFEYLDQSLAFKCVKDQVAIVLKGRQGSLKKRIEKGKPWLQNCMEAHWEQLKKVLVQEENVERVV